MSNKHTYKYSSNVLTAQFEVATLGVVATAPSIQLTESAGGQLCRMRIDPSDGSIKFEVNDGAGGGWVDAGIGGGGGGGSFSGPGSSTDNAIVRFDGTGGATGQNSIPTIDDDGRIHSNLTALGDVLDYFFTGQTENNSEAIKIGFNASNGNHYWTEIESVGNVDLSGRRNRSMRFNCRTNVDTATAIGSAVFVVNGEHSTAAATLVNAKLFACTNADSEVFSVGPTGLVEATGLNIGRVANNTVTGTYASVTSGQYNTAAGDYSTAAGDENEANGDYSGTLSGEDCVNDGPHSVIAGGSHNTIAASAIGSCVPGGLSNTAATSYSTAIGTEAVTRNKGELTQSSGSFSTAGDSQVRRLHLRRQTTDATPTILTDDNAADTAGSWNCAVKTLQHYKVAVLGHRDNDTEFASFTMEGTVRRADGSDPTSLWDSIESWVQTSAAWDSYVSVGSGGIKLYVVGEAAKNINWSASVELVESTVS